MQFNIDVRNRFNSLQDENDDIQQQYDHFEKVIEESALIVVGKLPPKVKKNWVAKPSSCSNKGIQPRKSLYELKKPNLKSNGNS